MAENDPAPLCRAMPDKPFFALLDFGEAGISWFRETVHGAFAGL